LKFSLKFVVNDKSLLAPHDNNDSERAQ